MPRHGGRLGGQRQGAVLGADGAVRAVGPAVQRALGSDYPGLLRFTVGLAETTTLLMAARIDDAYETARQFCDFAESAQPGRAIGEVLLAQGCFWRAATPPRPRNYSNRLPPPWPARATRGARCH